MIENVTVNLSVDIRYEKDADKFFEKHEDVRKRYEDSLKEFLIGEHPERINVKTIAGKKDKYYRMRLGKWRVIFTYDEEIMLIVVNSIMAGSRGDIYKKIGGLKLF